MKNILSILFTMLVVGASAQEIKNEGLEVIEFNAAFSGGPCEYLEQLSDCEVARFDIQKDPTLQAKYKIVVVPTLIILLDGEEKSRVQANIMMQLEATREEVQTIIDEIIFESF